MNQPGIQGHQDEEVDSAGFAGAVGAAAGAMAGLLGVTEGRGAGADVAARGALMLALDRPPAAIAATPAAVLNPGLITGPISAAA